MSFRGRLAPPITQSSWVAWILAASVTLMLFLSIGLPVGNVRDVAMWRDAARQRELVRPEQLVFQTLPPPPVPTAAPAPVATQPAATRPAAPPTAAPSARAPVTVPRRANTAPDSAKGAGDTQRPRPSIPTSVLSPRTRIPRPTTSEPPRGADATPTCTAPCLAAARVGVYVPGHTLTAAERDSVLQALTRSIPKAARDAGGGEGSTGGTGGTSISPPRPGGLPPAAPVGGVSIPIGLPGGGPSRAQRKRDSTVNAQVLPILERLRLRADSVRAARRRDSLEAIAKQRRDSTSGAWH